jgi:serine/threonine protein phosphatase PrpC
MNYTFFAQTDPGLIRSNNEDSVTFDASLQVAVLADGMGGYNAGEVASGMTTTFIKSELVQWLSGHEQQVDIDHVASFIENCVTKTNRSILNAAISNVQYAGMGTTLVAGVFLASSLVLAHVGDSRCYRLRLGKLEQITKDHSMLQEQVDAGVLTPEQAAVSPGKNLLTRALGVEDVVKVEIHQHEVLAEDLYLMCSDGLTDMLDDEHIAGILGNHTSLPVMATELVERAKANGGRDNITVLLVQATNDEAQPGLMSRLFRNS